MAADREDDRPPGTCQLVRDLHAGRRRAHDQYAAIRQAGRRAVPRRRQLRHVGVQPRGEARDAGAAVIAGGDDDLLSHPYAVDGVHREPGAG
jgi:hypothetical protein